MGESKKVESPVLDEVESKPKSVVKKAVATGKGRARRKTAGGWILDPKLGWVLPRKKKSGDAGQATSS